MDYPQFPHGFLFGTASSAFQIEGSTSTDGRGASVWDSFCKQKGKIKLGHTADTACDTYREPLRDLDMMARLGLNSYRFSISWSRVLPVGKGQVNQIGLDYYRRLADACLERNLRPFVTLFHWDTPQALYEECKGFAGRDCAYYFADYTEVVVKALGDRVKDWITLNEPWEHSALGYLLGDHAPGEHNPWHCLGAVHHQLLGHGLALERIRAYCPDGQAGITLSLTPIEPAGPGVKQAAAARMANHFFNDIYLDAIFHGQYTEEFWNRIRPVAPRIHAGDMEAISKPIDFLGINYYSREFSRPAWYVPLLGFWVDEVETHGHEINLDGRLYTASGREVYAPAFYDLLMRIKNDYGNPPVIITENGAAFEDIVTEDRVHDPQRVRFLADYMHQAARAIQDGADIRGYFVWSFTDNFEWALGYSARFGLVYVDFDSQQRIVKDSGRWLAETIRAQG